MSELEFLSPDQSRPWNGVEPRLRSPLAAVLAGRSREVEDLSLELAKIEVRGHVNADSVNAEVVPITPERALVLCPFERGAEVRAKLRDGGATVVDMTGALACVRLPGVTTMRRLTDLDLDRLPAVGSVARIPALVLRKGDAFRLLFAQEYGDYLATVVLDTVQGLA